MRAIDIALSTHGQADEESDIMTDYYIAGRGGDMTPPMVEFALESLHPHPANPDHIQLQYRTFRMPAEGE